MKEAHMLTIIEAEEHEELASFLTPSQDSTVGDKGKTERLLKSTPALDMEHWLNSQETRIRSMTDLAKAEIEENE